MTDRATILLEGRKAWLERILRRSLETPALHGTDPLSPERREHLRDYAEDLYWNELEWESLTSEEHLDPGHLTELAFPGFLAFVRGLLLREALAGSSTPAEPRPEAVEDILHFLATRVIALEEELSGDEVSEPEKARLELSLTNRLINVVMVHLYGVAPEDLERMERELESH